MISNGYPGYFYDIITEETISKFAIEFTTLDIDSNSIFIEDIALYIFGNTSNEWKKYNMARSYTITTSYIW